MGSFEILAEIAVGIAGFGTIAIVLGRDPTPGSPEFYRTSSLFLSSLGALFLALLPIGLQTAAISEPMIWRISSAAVAAFLAAFAVVSVRLRRQHLERSLWLGPAVISTVATSRLLILVFLLLNTTGLVFAPGPVWVFFGVVWLLLYACLILVRIVFVPPSPSQAPANESWGRGDRGSTSTRPATSRSRAR